VGLGLPYVTVESLIVLIGHVPRVAAYAARWKGRRQIAKNKGRGFEKFAWKIDGS